VRLTSGIKSPNITRASQFSDGSPEVASYEIGSHKHRIRMHLVFPVQIPHGGDHDCTNAGRRKYRAADSAKPRPASVDAAAGAVKEIARIVAQIRRHWPHVRTLLRADSGFAREELMAWCEANGVHFLFGLQQNDRLIGGIVGELARAEVKSRRTGKPARFFKEFMYRTRRSLTTLGGHNVRVLFVGRFKPSSLAPGDVNMTATNRSRSFVTACREQNRNALRGRPELPLLVRLQNALC
jgi:hypothetical protein